MQARQFQMYLLAGYQFLVQNTMRDDLRTGELGLGLANQELGLQMKD
jgi:hypothetical protein